MHTVIEASHTERQTTLLVRTNGPLFDPSWEVQEVSLEDMVLAYLSQQAARSLASAAIGARAERKRGAAMIWVAWRQHRAEGLMMLGVLAVLGVFLLITGLEHGEQLSAAWAEPLSGADLNGRPMCCADAGVWDPVWLCCCSLTPFCCFLPLLLGALVGAPLVAREVEQRTHLLVWTQSITRLRWLTVKLALVLGAGLLASGALLAVLIWWYTLGAAEWLIWHQRLRYVGAGLGGGDAAGAGAGHVCGGADAPDGRGDLSDHRAVCGNSRAGRGRCGAPPLSHP